jgi:hypothetical protein
MHINHVLTAGFVAAVAVPVALAVAASASGGGADVIRSGSCSGSTDWKLKAKHDNGRIEVEGEVDSNKVGQTWNWLIRHNGSVSARGQATTQAPSGSFSVTRRVVNLAGIDKIVFRATNPKSGEVCRGVVRL